MKSKLATSFLALLFIAAPAMVAMSSPMAEDRANNAQSDVNHLPDISLIDQNGRSVSLASLRGRPVLVGFIHTMCKGPCEMMTAEMHSVAASLDPRHDSDVAMVQITTDPADDGPPQLLHYSQEQGVARKGWIFLTGTHESIERVMRIYGVAHEDSDDAMMHVMKLFLVAPDGRLAGTYPGMNVAPQHVASDIEILSRQYSHRRLPTSAH